MHARLATLMILASAAVLPAQGRGAQPPQAPAQGRMQLQPRDSMRVNRATLEEQVRQRIAKVTKEQLGLSDQQMAKLQETNRKYDEKRRLVVDQERDIRMALRDEMLRPDSARQAQVAALLDRVIKTQRQRVDILEQEQKELAGFLTPLQRAKYFALEQQIRQRVNQLRQARMQGRGGRMGGAGRMGGMGMGRGQGMPNMQQGRGPAGRGQPPPPSP